MLLNCFLEKETSSSFFVFSATDINVTRLIDVERSHENDLTIDTKLRIRQIQSKKVYLQSKQLKRSCQ